VAAPAPPPPPAPVAAPVVDVAAKYPKGNRAKAKEIYEEAYLDFQEDNMDAALPKFQSAVKADPSFGEAHLRLAECYVKKNRKDDAVEEYRAFLALEPKHIKAKLAQSFVDKFGK
jgi:Tfp pilus assembly protein PilF